MTNEELTALIQCAKAAGYSPHEIEPLNPYKMKGDTGSAIRIAAESLIPQMAAQWKRESSKSVETLETAAIRAGVGEMTQTAHNHMMETDRDYRASYEETMARREAGWLSKMDEEAKKLADLRERQQRGFSRATNNSQHCNDWNRRMANRMHEPARNMIR